MVPHLYSKTPGTQKSTQNLKITVIFGLWVKASLKLKTITNLDWIMVRHIYHRTLGTQKSA